VARLMHEVVAVHIRPTMMLINVNKFVPSSSCYCFILWLSAISVLTAIFLDWLFAPLVIFLYLFQKRTFGAVVSSMVDTYTVVV